MWEKMRLEYGFTKGKRRILNNFHIQHEIDKHINDETDILFVNKTFIQCNTHGKV